VTGDHFGIPEAEEEYGDNAPFLKDNAYGTEICVFEIRTEWILSRSHADLGLREWRSTWAISCGVLGEECNRMDI
jgi:hypothetical protein